MCISSRPLNDDDDIIEVVCPDLSNGTGRLFQVKRSTLSRSPTFAEFFKSSHYLEGSNTRITFMIDPAACFHVVHCYLIEGPDKYSKIRLRVHISMSYRIANRFVVLVRLHLLATKLDLPGLADMAYESIIETDRFVDPLCCITVAKFIFAKNAGYDQLLKDWCYKQIGYHFAVLRRILEWIDAMASLDQELSDHWTKLVETDSAIAMALDEEASETSFERAISRMSSDDQERAVSVFEAEDLTFEDFINKIREEEDPTFEDEWEDVEELVGEDDVSIIDTRSRRSLGSPHLERDVFSKIEVPATPPNTLILPGTAKARQVMGLDGNNGSVVRWRELEAKRASRIFHLL